LNRYRITLLVIEPCALSVTSTWPRRGSAPCAAADLPVAYSQGFHPLPKFTFASALPVGCTSEAEVMDVVLAEPMDSADMAARLAPALPAGIAVTSIAEVPLNAPALQAALRWAEYVVTVETDENAGAHRIPSANASGRPGAPARAARQELRLASAGVVVGGRSSKRIVGQLIMRLRADANAGTGRPDEVLAALGWPTRLCKFIAAGWALRPDRSIAFDKTHQASL